MVHGILATMFCFHIIGKLCAKYGEGHLQQASYLGSRNLLSAAGES